MRSPTLFWVKRVGRVVAVLAIITCGWAGYLRLTGNFHAVEPGEVYRSGQLSGSQFAERIRERGIRTIINLRGNNSGRDWYDDEVKVSTAAGVVHIDFPISAGRQLTGAQVKQLTGLLGDAVKPLLIHCEAGADRSGLASALYELLIANRGPVEASRQLSFRFGHFPWLGSRTIAMDRTFERVTASLSSGDEALGRLSH